MAPDRIEALYFEYLKGAFTIPKLIQAVADEEYARGRKDVEREIGHLNGGSCQRQEGSEMSQYPKETNMRPPFITTASFDSSPAEQPSTITTTYRQICSEIDECRSLLEETKKAYAKVMYGEEAGVGQASIMATSGPSSGLHREFLELLYSVNALRSVISDFKDRCAL